MSRQLAEAQEENARLQVCTIHLVSRSLPYKAATPICIHAHACAAARSEVWLTAGG